MPKIINYIQKQLFYSIYKSRLFCYFQNLNQLKAEYQYNLLHMQKKTVRQLNSCQVLSKVRVLRKLDSSSCKISPKKQYQKVEEMNSSKVSPIIRNREADKLNNRSNSLRRNQQKKFRISSRLSNQNEYKLENSQVANKINIEDIKAFNLYALSKEKSFLNGLSDTEIEILNSRLLRQCFDRLFKQIFKESFIQKMESILSGSTDDPFIVRLTSLTSYL